MPVMSTFEVSLIGGQGNPPAFHTVDGEILDPLEGTTGGKRAQWLRFGDESGEEVARFPADMVISVLRK